MLVAIIGQKWQLSHKNYHFSEILLSPLQEKSFVEILTNHFTHFLGITECEITAPI